MEPSRDLIYSRRLRGRTRLAGAQDDPAGEPVHPRVGGPPTVPLLSRPAARARAAALLTVVVHTAAEASAGRAVAVRERRGAQRRGRPGHRRRGSGRGGLAGRPPGRRSSPQATRSPTLRTATAASATRETTPRTVLERPAVMVVTAQARRLNPRAGRWRLSPGEERPIMTAISGASQAPRTFRRAAQPRLPAVPRRRGSRDDGRQRRARHHLLPPGLVLHRRLDAVGRTVVQPTARSDANGRRRPVRQRLGY